MISRDKIYDDIYECVRELFILLKSHDFTNLDETPLRLDGVIVWLLVFMEIQSMILMKLDEDPTMTPSLNRAIARIIFYLSNDSLNATSIIREIQNTLHMLQNEIAYNGKYRNRKLPYGE